MSLFDVIRYPITDIFNQDEIGRLPKGITIPWLTECANFTGFVERDLSKLKSTDCAALWANVLVVKGDEFWDNKERRCILKAHLTSLLRDRIRDYD